MNPKVIIGVVVTTLIIMGLGIFLAYKPAAEADPKLVEFAKCIGTKATMYGAYWCPHCQSQKKLFGSAFAEIPYVECTVETQKCLDTNVQSYPTWVFADGSRQTGEMGFDDLATKTSCPLP